MEQPGSTVRIIAPAKQLPLRLRPAVPLSDDALFDFCRMNRELRVERTEEGELLIMSPTGGRTGYLNGRLTVRLGAWAERDGTGIYFDSSTGFVLPNGAERSPDFAWVRRERWEALPRSAQDKFPRLCPDFVVELRSPSDELDELKAKLQEYLNNGALLGWLLDPIEKRAFVYRLAQTVETVEGTPALSGDPVLPGLSLDLTTFW